MSFQLYKEGQGTWSRGALAFLVFGAGLYFAVELWRYFQSTDFLSSGLPLFGWEIGWRELIVVAILIPFGVLGVYLYNKPKLADFLIATETELRSQVVWPTIKEARNNVIVVVVACLLMGVWVTLVDYALRHLTVFLYH